MQRPKIKLSLDEIFSKVQGVRSMKDRVDILQANDCYALRLVLQGNFNDWVQFDLPEGAPPFKEDNNVPDRSAGRIDKNIKILKKLTKGSAMNPTKKEIRFVQFLESVNVNDAKIVIAMKDKELKKLFPSITPALVNKAFPGIIKDK
jgi:hypothetical protein|tara:strand:+ start:1250 stop:1690 length:441 start_codon:yes stop_codon:yes gene_type:complete